MFMNQLDYICDYCHRSFTRKYNLRIHIENCHLNAVTCCDICNQSFGSPAGLQQHLSRGHNRNQEGFPECDICGRIFKRKQNIVSHMVTIHLLATEIRCQYCMKTFTTRRNLKRHVYQIHNPDFEYLECDDCNKIFKGKHSLIAHIQANHNCSEKTQVKCNICDKTYTHTRNLKRHIETFHGAKGEFRCCHCPKVYNTNQSLQRHNRFRHNFKASVNGIRHQQRLRAQTLDSQKELKRPYPCENCEKAFSVEPMLRQHIRLKHSFSTFYSYCRTFLLRKQSSNQNCFNTFYTCEFCCNVFSSVYVLKDHMRLGHDVEYCLSTCNVCFNKFYSKETAVEHKKICLPPATANACNYCDKLFTDVSSLEFHTRIFHPQSQITDSDITSTNPDENAVKISIFKCVHCKRVYYSDRSLKHHMKLKHTTDGAVECQYCGKVCNNKYYLASHMKIVHADHTWSKCDYCDKQFKSKRNIRRHIEYTHLGMQRYKCVECETLFKEKRSLRKHVRTKHPNSMSFPQCHICHKRFESAKSCKIHLKLVHSLNLDTHPCHLCSVSFSSYESLQIHIQTSHLAEDEIYKCEGCNLVFKGHEAFEEHNEIHHINVVPNMKQKLLPRCILCMKDFSTRKTLKRHIKKFHAEFDADALATYGSRKRIFNVDCEQCIKTFNDDYHYNLFLKLKHLKNAIIFNCSECSASYDGLEFAIQRYRQVNMECKSKMILSELCTAEMSEGDLDDQRGFMFSDESMEPESTTNETVKQEIPDEFVSEFDVKTEPASP